MNPCHGRTLLHFGGSGGIWTHAMEELSYILVAAVGYEPMPWTNSPTFWWQQWDMNQCHGRTLLHFGGSSGIWTNATEDLSYILVAAVDMNPCHERPHLLFGGSGGIWTPAMKNFLHFSSCGTRIWALCHEHFDGNVGIWTNAMKESSLTTIWWHNQTHNCGSVSSQIISSNNLFLFKNFFSQTKVRVSSAWVQVHRGGVQVRVHRGGVQVRTRYNTASTVLNHY